MLRPLLLLGLVLTLVVATGSVPALASVPKVPAAQEDPHYPGPAPAHAWIGPDGETLPFRDDDEVIDFMRTAEVVSMKELSGSKTRPFKVLLEKDGVRMNAIFRTVDVSRQRVRIGGRFHMFFRDNALFECAAYGLARVLGLDNVPPAVARSIDGRWGSLQVWVEESMTGNDRRRQGLQPPDPQAWFLRRMVITVWDQLIFNDDRNPGNILIATDWHLWMVDHTRAFQRNPRLRDPEQVTHCERHLWQRLRGVSNDEIRAAVTGYLNPAEIEDLLERREKLVSRIEARILERGEEAVIYDIVGN